jgi:hypothetical protein
MFAWLERGPWRRAATGIFRDRCCSWRVIFSSAVMLDFTGEFPACYQQVVLLYAVIE